MTKVYLSPSLQSYKIGYGNFGSEQFRMSQIADSIERHLYAGKHQIAVYRSKQDMTLAEAVADSNSKKPDIHVAIHSNASDTHTARGPMGFAYKIGTKSDELAHDVYDEVAKISPATGHGIFYSTQLNELKKTTAPTTLIEVAFHDNPDDARFIIDNIDNIGGAIARGILKNLNARYRSNIINSFNDLNDFLNSNPMNNQNFVDFESQNFGMGSNIKHFKNPRKGPKCIRLMILFANESDLKSALILSNRFGAPMINIRNAKRFLNIVNSFIIVGRDSIGIRDSFRIDEGDSVKNLEKVLSLVNETDIT